MSLYRLAYALKHMAGKHPQKTHAGSRGAVSSRYAGIVDMAIANGTDFTNHLFELANAGKIDIRDAAKLFDEWSASKMAGRSGKNSQNSKVPQSTEYMDSKTAADKLGVSDRNMAQLEKLESDWLQGANPEAKRAITDFYAANPETKLIRLAQMQSSMPKYADMDFDKFLDTDITLYRGGIPTFGDTFATFTLAKGAAENFAKQREGLYKVRIKPRDLIGFAPTGATEAFVPEELSNGKSVKVTKL